MLFRAIFWIGLVSLLMPHEPDLGFGRPHLGAAFPSIAGLMNNGLSTPGVCAGHQEACGASISLVDGVQSLAVRSLDQVKREIEESQREHYAAPHM
jgi:hypothetical protein